VIDTHHHIWRRKDVAWLADPPIPRMFGDYFGIRRDYPVEEFMNDVKPQDVTKSVHVTAMWGPGRALDETRWLQAVGDKHGFPHGIVCNADLSDPDVESALKAQKQFPNVRGVRQMLYCARCSIGTARLCGRPRHGLTSVIHPISGADSLC
jgi:predicted TIM-barrel fold metal-dependent hydrolase